MATIVAFLPLLLAGNIAGNEMVWPMAAVIVGGLITSTLLNLFVVPALYLRWPGTALEPTHLPASIQPTPEVA
jgi:multidrug efflux pump subunit AcrB